MRCRCCARAERRARADVDGTLIHAVGPDANKLHKRAFSHAFKVRRTAGARGHRRGPHAPRAHAAACEM